MYLTYERYQELGGTLDVTTFNNLEYEAETYIDYATFNRLKKFDTIPETVERCVFNILEKVQNIMNTVSGDEEKAGIASQSNDGVSISYNVLNASQLLESSKDEITKTIKRYLDDVRDSEGKRILYRGV